MMDDFKVISHEFNHEIKIVPLSDTHIGSEACQIKQLQNTIKQIEEDPYCYTMLVGDIIDNAIVAGKVPNAVYSNNLTPMQQIEKAVELFRPIKDKILSVVPGNHEYRSEKIADFNPLYLICCELGIQDRYRKNMALTRICVGARKNNEGIGRHHTYTILSIHGTGSEYTAVKKDKDFGWNIEGVDMIISGHTHNGEAKDFERYYVTQKGTVGRKTVPILVLDSFQDNEDYNLRAMKLGASHRERSFILHTGEEKEIEISIRNRR